MDLKFQILHFYKYFNMNIQLILTKKATIGNFMKNVVENVTSSTLFVCLFCFFCGRHLSKELGIPIGILPTSGAGVDGNAPYQAQELQIGQSWDTNKPPTS